MEEHNLICATRSQMHPALSALHQADFATEVRHWRMDRSHRTEDQVRSESGVSVSSPVPHLEKRR
jgi:hypothetical protein